MHREHLFGTKLQSELYQGTYELRVWIRKGGKSSLSQQKGFLYFS